MIAFVHVGLAMSPFGVCTPTQRCAAPLSQSPSQVNASQVYQVIEVGLGWVSSAARHTTVGFRGWVFKAGWLQMLRSPRAARGLRPKRRWPQPTRAEGAVHKTALAFCMCVTRNKAGVGHTRMRDTALLQVRRGDDIQAGVERKGMSP